MTIDELIANDKNLQTWDNACRSWFSLLLYHIWQHVDYAKIPEYEKKELMLDIVDRLLTEHRIVFEVPERGWDEPWKTWHADKETILQSLRDRYPDLNDPDYENKIINYWYENGVAWIVQEGDPSVTGEPTAPEVGSLYCDGMYISGPEWQNK